MPRRSNEFQRLVFLVKSHAAADAVVTESKLLSDRRTGGAREVDVCIECMVAGHSVLVCIECQDHGRKSDVSWVEQMKAKHDDLPTDRLVLVSHSGFSREAERKAQAYGIETVSFKALNANTTRGLFGNKGSLWSKILAFSPTKVLFQVAAVRDLLVEDISVFTDTIVYDGEKCEICNAKELVDRLIRTVMPEALRELSPSEQIYTHFEMGFGQIDPDGPNSPIDLQDVKKILTFKAHGQTEENNETPENVDAVLQQSREGRVMFGDTGPLYLRKLEPDVMREVVFVRVVGTFSLDVSEFKLR